MNKTTFKIKTDVNQNNKSVGYCCRIWPHFALFRDLNDFAEIR